MNPDRLHTPLALCQALVLTFLVATRSDARENTPPLSMQRQVLPLTAVAQFDAAPVDPIAELATDRKAAVQTPLRFAVGQKVAITPVTHGTWEQLPEGRLWRLRISAKGATDLNLGFSTFWLPEGATLHLNAEPEEYYQGPFTAQDNTAQGQFWTPVVPGDAAVLELFVPATATQEPQLVLSQVSGGFRDMFHRRKDLSIPKAESCEIDVVCPRGRPWTNEIRSVARYSISGTTLCSGQLVGNARGDYRNFFLTANHCGLDSSTAPTVVVYWNYQSPTCGLQSGGSLAQNQSGAIFRASKSDVDFSLIELSSIPDPSFNVFYSGWDRSGNSLPGCVGIHHPNADEKSISFSSNAVTTTDSCIGTGGSGTHWNVIWSAGVTEPGSSGSGIWDPATHRLVGTLSGGGSDCSTPTSPDCYGKFSVAWASGSSSANRLRDWLDPENSGVTGIPGSNPVLVSRVIPAGSSLITESCSPGNQAIDPGETVTVGLALRNVGGLNTTNLVATLLATGGVTSPGDAQTYGALNSGAAAITRSYSFVASGACGGTLTATLQLQDGSRDLGTATFTFILGAPSSTTIFSQNFDSVSAPNLPAGWTSSGTLNWATTTAQRDTTPNSVFVADSAIVTDDQLTSPAIAISSGNTQMSFRHLYLTETNYDGGVLEISINGGAFDDIITAGGSFVTNGYNLIISDQYGNPLGGRSAWSGGSGHFITTIVNLPVAAAGQNIRLRWRMGSDDSYGLTGWYVDTVTISQVTYVCCSLNPNDFTPPALAVTGYSDNQWVPTNTITLRGTASDAGRGDNGIASVMVNGAMAANGTAIGTGVASWSSNLSLRTGSNNVTIVATDNAGNATNVVLHLFSDSSRPTLAITTPTLGLRWSNAVLMAKGTAKDNVRVDGVYYRLNSGDWTLAATTNSWTNWTAQLELTPGTNTLSAYAIDPAGSQSTMSTVKFSYVVTDRPVVQIIGKGTVTPNYNGAVLELGKKLTMKAVPATGFGFIGWTGSIVTNAASITFTMASNLVFTATFVDNQNPALTISSPKPALRWSNDVFTVKGIAKDNVMVATVQYQLNNGAWLAAATTNGWTNWSADINLVAGTNTVSAFAQDTAGNRSPTNAVRFVFVVTSPITLATNGLGSIKRSFTGSVLEVGRAYTVTGIAGTGQMFSNWVGSVNSSQAALTFLMQSNMFLQADFVPNPFLTLKGGYNGLFYPTNIFAPAPTGASNSGYATFSLTETGKFSGKLMLAGSNLPFAGVFDLQFQAQASVPRAGRAPLAMALELDRAGHQIHGTVGDGALWVSDLLALRAASGSNPHAGNYTLLVRGCEEYGACFAVTNVPFGDSPAAVKVSPTGAIQMAGSMADGATISQSSAVSEDGLWGLYVSLYGGRGYLLGWLSFDPGQRVEPLDWLMPVGVTKSYYTNGFDQERESLLTPYVKPPTHQNAVAWTNAQAVFHLLDNLTPLAFTNEVVLSNNILRVVSGSISNLTMSVTLSNGLFNGTFKHPVNGKSTTFKGAMIQDPAPDFLSGGWFLGTNGQGGIIRFHPQ